MSNFMQTTANDIGKLLLRLVVGGSMLFHGTAKVMHGIDFIKQGVDAAGFPHLLAYGVYLGEFVGPLLLLLGLFSRLSALMITIDMIMALVLVHHSQIFTVNSMSGGWAIELQALYLVGSFAIVLMGGGKYSLSRSNKLWA